MFVRMYFYSCFGIGSIVIAEDMEALLDNNTPSTGFSVKDNNNNTLMRVQGDGNVGIGTTVPGQKLTVAGTIESTSGGIKFPDRTTQTSAVASAATLTLLGQAGETSTPEDNWVTITFDVEKRDDANLHSNTVNNSRITIAQAGIYSINAFVTRNSTANTNIGIRLLINGTPAYEYWSVMGSITVKQVRPITVIQDLNIGDFLEIQIYAAASSGTVLTVPSATFFSVQKL